VVQSGKQYVSRATSRRNLTRCQVGSVDF